MPEGTGQRIPLLDIDEAVAVAEEHGIPTPLNQQLLTMVKGIEHSLQTD